MPIDQSYFLKDFRLYWLTPEQYDFDLIKHFLSWGGAVPDYTQSLSDPETQAFLDLMGPRLQELTRLLIQGKGEGENVWRWVEDVRYNGYDRNRQRWERIWTHYRADTDILRTQAFLIRHKQGEHPDNYRDRQQLSDYDALLSEVVAGIRGRMMRLEGDKSKIVRQWGEVLGDPLEESSPSYHLWRNADGAGTNYLTMIEKVITRLVLKEEVWGMVDGRRILYFDPEVVVDYDTTSIYPQWAKVMHYGDGRKDFTGKPERVQRYSIYLPTGYRVFERRREGATGAHIQPVTPFVLYGGTRENPFVYMSPEGVPVLPMWRTTLPLEYHVGYYLSRKLEVLFNQTSERDNLLRTACMPSFVFVGNDTEFGKMVQRRLEGSNVYQLPTDASNRHEYISPSVGPAEVRTTVIKDKRDNFMRSAFQSYEEAVQGRDRVTATEISTHQVERSGSFLNTLGTALNEFEQDAMYRMEQVLAADEPALWGGFSVERPRDYQPLNASAKAREDAQMIFPDGKIPLDTEGQVEWLKRYYDNENLPWDEAAVRAMLSDRDQARRLKYFTELSRTLPLEEAGRLSGIDVTGVLDDMTER